MFHEGAVPIDPQYLSALDELYRTKRVALLDDLREALGTDSRTTIFRVLSAAGYLTSIAMPGATTRSNAFPTSIATAFGCIAVSASPDMEHCAQR